MKTEDVVDRIADRVDLPADHDTHEQGDDDQTGDQKWCPDPFHGSATLPVLIKLRFGGSDGA